MKSAYLSISKNTRHGDKMICSHQFCREGGHKFIFCSTCRIPVAKRKFKHHAHLSQISSAASSSTATHARGETDSVQSDSSVSASMEQDIPSPKRVEAWNRLLLTRPPKDDREAFAKWMEDIFLVSSRQTFDHHCVPNIPALLAALQK
jgi:hypothetical protein